MNAIAPPGCRTGKVTALADHQLDAELVPKLAYPRSQRRD